MLLQLRRADDRSRPIGPEWLAEAGRDITALGGTAALTLCTLAVAGFLCLNRKHKAMLFVLAATVGGTAIAYGLKAFFARPRPDVVPHLAVVSTSSFPSAHSMMSAVVYLTLGALLVTLVDRRRLKSYILTVALLLTMLVGASRVYLGVHFPTDVLAGWCAGLVWALVCALTARWLQRRGVVEDEAVDQTVET